MSVAEAKDILKQAIDYAGTCEAANLAREALAALEAGSKSEPCRRCDGCRGEEHHWLEVCDEDTGEPIMKCKHCPATKPYECDLEAESNQYELERKSKPELRAFTETVGVIDIFFEESRYECNFVESDWEDVRKLWENVKGMIDGQAEELKEMKFLREEVKRDGKKVLKLIDDLAAKDTKIERLRTALGVAQHYYGSIHL